MTTGEPGDKAVGVGVEPPPFEILASTPIHERRPRILKYGDTFAVFDHYGDIVENGANPEGIFHKDTRHLSRQLLLLNGSRPLLLSSNVQTDLGLLTVDLANPDMVSDEGRLLPRDSLHLRRVKFLWGATCYERLVLHNFDLEPRNINIVLQFDGDFWDLFEVRGQKRPSRGSCSAKLVSTDEVRLDYRALDGETSSTMIRFEPTPSRLRADMASFDLFLEPGRKCSIFIEICCAPEEARESPRKSFYLNLREDRRWRRTVRSRIAEIKSSDSLFDEVFNRAISDLYMLTTDTEYGPYPYAGIPWYSTVFGRDAIIAAMQSLWIDPEIARGVLRYLAAHQATETDTASEAEPGKILHEVRAGEMARMGEVPFKQYYGSADSTPLFVALAGDYLRHTGDIETIRVLWPRILAALSWITQFGDKDQDGFIEYLARGPNGLRNQGWKDSEDSVFHAGGELAEGAISLCEVQGYVYLAMQQASYMARQLGEAKVSSDLASRALVLKERFEEAFWAEDLSTYVLALDGEKRPCRVKTSNAGHALFSGIAAETHARRVADTLLASDSFCGWGIRTVARSEKRYNPMAYHNGSVWPHDNALIALGFANYGLKNHALKVFQAIFDAATFMDLHRLPELFCGFVRRHHGGPTYYPVACSPQAWASTSLLAMLKACLGLNFDYETREVRFDKPVLPAFVEELVLRNLRIGGERIDFALRQHNGDIAVEVLDRPDDVRVIVVH